VVDIDLEKFFDRVNHDILMGLVAKRWPTRVLEAYPRFSYRACLMYGAWSSDGRSTPQGGPLSPLLSNLISM